MGWTTNDEMNDEQWDERQWISKFIFDANSLDLVIHKKHSFIWCSNALETFIGIKLSAEKLAQLGDQAVILGEE